MEMNEQKDLAEIIRRINEAYARERRKELAKSQPPDELAERRAKRRKK